MLPSKGFFKKNDCPFYEKGLCVRPHCHFRHRKKVLNDKSIMKSFKKKLEIMMLACTRIENDKNASSDKETNEVEEDEEAEGALLRLIANKVSEPGKTPCTSTSDGSGSKEGNSAHDTLFAKLVNQSNPYEKINRHVPCAYTPTPQTKKVELKNKTVVNGVASLGNSEKSLELITKARMLLKNYCKETIKKSEIKSHSGDEQKSRSCEQQQSTLKKESDPEGHGKDNEDLVHSKDKNDNGNESLKNSTGKTKTVKKSNEFNTLTEFIENKDEFKKNPEMGQDGELRPERNSLEHNIELGHFNKSCEKEKNSSLKESEKVESQSCSETSEIELMKKLINNHVDDEIPFEKKDKQSSEEKENKDKSVFKPKESKSSHHSSSSRHKSGKSSSSSRSSSKHSRSHSSRHSRSSSSSSRHRSSSSRHHSHSTSRKSHGHHRSSSRHSGDHHKKRHSEKYEAESERHKVSKNHRDDGDKKKSSEGHSKPSISHGEDEDGEDGEDEEDGDEAMDADFSFVNNEDMEGEIGATSRKRKISSDEEFTSSKYLSLSNFGDFEDDADAIEKECLEIFNSYSNNSESQSSKIVQDITVPNAEYENAVQAKRRTAHASTTMADHSALRHKTVRKHNNIKSAQELMLERYKIAEKAREAQQEVVPQPSSAPLLGLNRPPVRIAAVSNIQQMLLAKKAIQEKINQGLKVNERSTIAHTVAPGSSRVAHIPKASDLATKPIIREGSKQVPIGKRQMYLEKLLIETNKIYPTKKESSEEALKLEQEIFTLHSGSSAAYHAAFVSLLMKTRRKVASVKGETVNTNPPKPKVSHFDILSRGKKNFSVIKTKKMDIKMLTEKQIYEELLRFKLTEEELKTNGFPMSGDRPGYAVCSFNFDLKYYEKYHYIRKLTGNRRYCVRCSKLYDVDPKTLKQYKEGPETCSYHPGRKKSGGRNCERIYNCCNSSSTEGCSTHVRHVTDSNDYENFPNCVRTLAKDEDNDPGVFALDCEMVYSRLGTELARVTVVNLKKEVVYDTLVKPKYPVDCYNTVYSGIDEKMMEGVETTLQDVQAVLLSMFSDKTILIGHSLDSDLRALHLIHDTVVDTSVVFKNEKYFPSKYGLKELCARKISKIIQDNVNGHDSSEDAIAALELMLQHVKEEVARYDSIESYEADRER